MPSRNINTLKMVLMYLTTTVNLYSFRYDVSIFTIVVNSNYYHFYYYYFPVTAITIDIKRINPIHICQERYIYWFQKILQTIREKLYIQEDEYNNYLHVAKSCWLNFCRHIQIIMCNAHGNNMYRKIFVIYKHINIYNIIKRTGLH